MECIVWRVIKTLGFQEKKMSQDVVLASIKARDEFLQGYDEILALKACKIADVDVENVDLWTGPEDGVFVHVPQTEMQKRKLKGSACRLVLCNLLGISENEYVDSLIDANHDGNDLKFYRNADGKFAIVYQIPSKVLKHNARVRALYTVLATAAAAAVATIGYKRLKRKPVQYTTTDPFTSETTEEYGIKLTGEETEVDLKK